MPIIACTFASMMPSPTVMLPPSSNEASTSSMPLVLIRTARKPPPPISEKLARNGFVRSENASRRLVSRFEVSGNESSAETPIFSRLKAPSPAAGRPNV